MLTLEEILKGKLFSSLPLKEQGNVKVLWFRMNKVRNEYGKPMTVTSGYRSMQDHLRIYRQKGITDQSKIPMSSKHLTGCAVDIADADGELMQWCVANETLLRQIGLWLEKGTKGWVHFQSEPFKSYKLGGTIFFNP